MHKLYKQANELTGAVIGASIEVHKLMGPGLLESIYSKCLCRELEIQGIKVEREVVVPIRYKGCIFDEPLRVDLLVDECLLVELKAVDTILPIHKAQLLSYMQLMDIPLGLLINFNTMVLKKGIQRLILRGADTEDINF
jgi:GxxExxY protein